MEKITQNPDKPVPGEALQRNTVAGRKVQFVNQTSGAQGSLTIPAGEYRSFIFTLTLRNPELPTINRTEENIIGINDCIAWLYANLFVDNNNQDDYFFGIGTSLSAGQKNIQLRAVHPHWTTDPDNGDIYSHVAYYTFKNDDGSPHTIYTDARWKFIIYGEQSA